MVSRVISVPFFPSFRSAGTRSLWSTIGAAIVPALGTWAGCADFVAGIEDTSEASVLQAVRQWRPDVCFSHNMRPLEVERALLAEWPVVKMMHGYFGTCASGLKMHAFPSTQACDRALGAACLAMYVPRHCGQLHPRSLVSGYRWALAQKSLLSRYRSIAVASAHMGAEYARHGVPSSQINVLPLFPTLDGSLKRADGGAVLFAGRMTTLKGGDLLVDAVADASRRLGRSVPLIMAGDGPQRSAWAGQAALRGVNAEFTGWLDRAGLATVFHRASMVVIPSVWPEPFGLVGLEAGAMGLPAIAFDVGGIREWLRPGENGVLVPPERGTDGLADAIVSMLLTTPPYAAGCPLPRMRWQPRCREAFTLTALNVFSDLRVNRRRHEHVVHSHG